MSVPTILVVEDDLVIREMLRFVLQQISFGAMTIVQVHFTNP